MMMIMMLLLLVLLILLLLGHDDDDDDINPVGKRLLYDVKSKFLTSHLLLLSDSMYPPCCRNAYR